MNSLEALNKIREVDMWARPVSWRGCGIAISWQPKTERSRERFLHVPSRRPVDAILNVYIFEDWEIVDPHVVLQEIS